MAFIRFDENGWFKEYARPPFASKAEELVKGNYWTDIETIDDDGNVFANRLRLVNGEVVLASQEERDAYDEQLKQERIQAIADTMNEVTKYEAHTALVALGLGDLWEQFKNIPFFDDTIYFRFDNPYVQQGLSLLPEGTEEQVKLKIAEMRVC